MPTLIANNLGLISGEKNVEQQLVVVAPTQLTIPMITVNQADEPLEMEEDNDRKPIKKTLWEAAEQADMDTIRHYMERTTDIQRLMNTRDPTTAATLLHLSITSISPLPTQKEMDQRLEVVQLLLTNGADATACNLYGVQAIHMIPLHIPTSTLPYLDLLLNNEQVDINARDGDGWTPLHYAARFCQPPDIVMQMLVKRGGKVNATTGNKTCLFGLIANGDYVECFQWMVDTAKADIRLLGDFATGGRATLVLQAVKYGRLGILRYLIHHGPLLNKLKPVITLYELEQVQLQSNHHGKDIEKEIEILCDFLERDSRSLVAKQRRKQSRDPWLKKLQKRVLNRIL